MARNPNNLLSESTRSKHFGDKVDVSIGNVNPRSVKFHNVFVLDRFEKMNFTVKPLKVFRALQKIIQLHLIPCNFNPLILIKCSIPVFIANPTHKITQKSITHPPFLQTRKSPAAKILNKTPKKRGKTQLNHFKIKTLNTKKIRCGFIHCL